MAAPARPYSNPESFPTADLEGDALNALLAIENLAIEGRENPRAVGRCARAIRKHLDRALPKLDELEARREPPAAVRAVDKLPVPLNVELLGKAADVVEAGRRLVATMAARCEDCGVAGCEEHAARGAVTA